jgi:tetratricopeptide (TPR) repeat protein
MKITASSLSLIMVAFLMAPSSYALDATWQTLNNSAEAAFKAGLYTEAEKLFRQAIAQAQGGTNEDRELEKSLHDLGWMYDQLKRYGDAEKMYQQLLQEDLKIYGPNSIQVAHAHRLLGDCEVQLGQYAQAEADYREGLAIAEAVNKGNPSTDNSNELIGLLQQLGKVCKLENKIADYEKYMKLAQQLAYARLHP